MFAEAQHHSIRVFFLGTASRMWLAHYWVEAEILMQVSARFGNSQDVWKPVRARLCFAENIQNQCALVSSTQLFQMHTMHVLGAPIACINMPQAHVLHACISNDSQYSLTLAYVHAHAYTYRDVLSKGEKSWRGSRVLL